VSEPELVVCSGVVVMLVVPLLVPMLLVMLLVPVILLEMSVRACWKWVMRSYELRIRIAK